MGSYRFLVSLTVVYILLLPMIAKGGAVDRFRNEKKDSCQNVECGKGKCVDNSTMSKRKVWRPNFHCECEPGWNQVIPEDDGRYYYVHSRPLPCVIPQCTINEDNNGDYKQDLPPTTTLSITDPYEWRICGKGGIYNRIGYHDYKYICECEPNYFNLLNMTSLPCYKEGSLGSDCAKLGIKVPNSTVHNNAVLSTESSTRAMKVPLDGYMLNVHQHGYAMGGN